MSDDPDVRRTVSILFVQGGGEGTHDEWDNKLVDSLQRELGAGYTIHFPRMPNEGDPTYALWKQALQREFAELEDGAIVIGHSVGGTILINFLAEDATRVRPKALCLLAAPYVGEGGWESDEFDSRTSLASRLPEGLPIFLYHGRNDDTVPFAHVELYAAALPRALVRRLANRDHQFNNTLAELAADIRQLDSGGTVA